MTLSIKSRDKNRLKVQETMASTIRWLYREIRDALNDVKTYEAFCLEHRIDGNEFIEKGHPRWTKAKEIPLSKQVKKDKEHLERMKIKIESRQVTIRELLELADDDDSLVKILGRGGGDTKNG